MLGSEKSRLDDIQRVSNEESGKSVLKPLRSEVKGLKATETDLNNDVIRVTLIPLMYESACPKGLDVLESSGDVFHLLHRLNSGEQVGIMLVNPMLIQLFTLNNVRVRLVTSAMGFVDFPLSTANGELIEKISLESVASEIAASVSKRNSSDGKEIENEVKVDEGWPRPLSDNSSKLDAVHKALEQLKGEENE